MMLKFRYSYMALAPRGAAFATVRHLRDPIDGFAVKTQRLRGVGSVSTDRSSQLRTKTSGIFSSRRGTQSPSPLLASFAQAEMGDVGDVCHCLRALRHCDP